MIRFFAGHATAANLLMVILLAMGLFALPNLQRATFPDFTPTAVEVRVPYPGATAADVEEAICRRIESAVDGIEFVDEVRAVARDNIGIVTLEMRKGGDPTTFLTDVKTEVEAITEFPDRAEPPSVRPIMRTDAVVSVAITGDMDAVDLKEYAETVKERLAQLPDVSLVRLDGFGQRQLLLEVTSTSLMQHGISADDLARVVGAQSVDLPAGVVHTPDRDVVLRFTDERRTIDELTDLVVLGSSEGGEVRLGDIATVSDAFEPDEQKILFDGRRAAILTIEKTKQEDTLTVFDAVSELVADEIARTPDTISLTLTQDRSSIVRDRLDLLVRNGWQGLLLVFLVMWLFFGLRYSFWVAMGLPVAFMGTFFFLPLLGMTINMLTMVALLMALGLLMDDAIVIAENIATELEKGKGGLDSIVAGVRGVAAGVLSSFLTTVAVFAPLAFIEGDIGTVLRVVPIVLILVLSVSLIEAFCILPHHLGGTGHGTNKQRGRFRTAIENAVVWTRERAVGPLVDVAVSWRYATLGIVVALFCVSVGLLASGKVKFQAFPQLDGDVAIARVLLPAGTPLARTEAVVSRLTTALAQVNEDLSPLQEDGAALVRHVTVRFNENADAQEDGAHVATILVDLLPADVRSGRVDDVLARWRELAGPIPDAVAIVFTQGAFGPAGRPLEIQLHGEDLARLDETAREVRDWLSQFVGVENLLTDLRPGKPEANVRMRPGAQALGISAAVVANQLRSAFHGATAGEIQVGREDFDVEVRLADADRRSTAAVDRFRVTLADGRQVPLGSIAEVEMSRGYSRIARVDRKRTATVIGEVDTAVTNTQEIVSKFREDLMPDLIARGIGVTLKGEVSEGGQTQRSMLRALLIGLVGVFVVVSFHFRSYLEPMAVMAAIPLALIGVIWGHKLVGIAVTMPSMLGFASLAGVVVNDSILLVEFIVRRRREGASIADAAKSASRDRFRAILLTSLTTIVGLMPLLAETSLQAQILIPLASSIVFGLIASTALVLVVLPSLYAILGDLGWARETAHLIRSANSESSVSQ